MARGYWADTSHNISHHICNYISSETGIPGVDFRTIVDYLILIVYTMKILRCSKTEMLSFINQFEEACENLRKQVPANIFSKIVYTDTRRKLGALKGFL